MNSNIINVSEFNSSALVNNTDGDNGQLDMAVNSNVLMTLQMPHNLTSGMNTDRGDYQNFIQNEDTDDFQLYAKPNINSARNLNMNSQARTP